MKTLSNVKVSDVKENVKDVIVIGNGDMPKLLCKAFSIQEGWMKSTKAIYIPNCGCIVQVTTQQRNSDESYSLSEALTFVPGVKITDDINNGCKLIIA